MMSRDIKKLIKKYPFIEIDKDSTKNGYTWLDDLEYGWNIAFGVDLCSDLKKALIKDNCLDKFKFIQIKEKYAELRIYADSYGENTQKVIDKYEDLSKYICGLCGKPARYLTSGWIYPLCENCIKKEYSSYRKIEDAYNFNSYEDVLKEIDKIKSK